MVERAQKSADVCFGAFRTNLLWDVTGKNCDRFTVDYDDDDDDDDDNDGL